MKSHTMLGVTRELHDAVMEQAKAAGVPATWYLKRLVEEDRGGPIGGRGPGRPPKDRDTGHDGA
jgi:hypothetical protein